jgi:hypothetical protein
MRRRGGGTCSRDCQSGRREADGARYHSGGVGVSDVAAVEEGEEVEDHDLGDDDRVEFTDQAFFDQRVVMAGGGKGTIGEVAVGVLFGVSGDGGRFWGGICPDFLFFFCHLS